MRIFLTGDNHIGLKYASHEQASVLCEKRIEAFEGMVKKANADKCELFVIAGDLFENTYSVSKRTVKALLDALSCFEGNVIVLPGNHDYYDKEMKVWQYFRDIMQTFDNITLITEYKPYFISCGDDDVVLYPALCTPLPVKTILVGSRKSRLKTMQLTTLESHTAQSRAKPLIMRVSIS